MWLEIWAFQRPSFSTLPEKRVENKKTLLNAFLFFLLLLWIFHVHLLSRTLVTPSQQKTHGWTSYQWPPKHFKTIQNPCSDSLKTTFGGIIQTVYFSCLFSANAGDRFPGRPESCWRKTDSSSKRRRSKRPGSHGPPQLCARFKRGLGGAFLGLAWCVCVFWLVV